MTKHLAYAPALLLGLLLAACGGIADLGGGTDGGPGPDGGHGIEGGPTSTTGADGAGGGSTTTPLQDGGAIPPLDGGGTSVELPDATTVSTNAACYTGAAFTPPQWKPPTPLHQGACTSDQLFQFLGCFGSTPCTSGSSTCDGCLQTSVNAAAYGPIITGSSVSDDYSGQFINFGGCQANIDGNTAAGSCGSQTNAWYACDEVECPEDCGDAGNSCAEYAWNNGCAKDTMSASCSNEWEEDGGVSQCEWPSLVNIWCGP